MLLWDLQIFFDSIDVKTLFAEAAEVGFPLLQLALSMLVHQAPRRLKLGTAIGEPILELGRSILAGCSRSTDVARVYTLRMVKTLACCHPLVKIYQHVDDISNLVTGHTPNALVAAAVRYAMHFKELAQQLLLTISQKSMVVPATAEATRFARIVNRHAIPMKVEKQGVDIGVDTSSAHIRTTKMQTTRINKTKPKAKRAGFLSRKNTKARRVALTGVHAGQTYGSIAVGMSPTNMNTCKSNVAEATGLMGAGACATSVLKWSFRKGRLSNTTADPRVTLPLAQVKSWMMIWRRASTKVKSSISRVWHKLYRSLYYAKSRWQMVRGPASAAICTLLDMSWKPVNPNCWIEPTGNLKATFDAIPGVTHHHVLDVIEQSLTQQLWLNASQAYCGDGMELGTPHFGPAALAHRDLLKEGRTEEAAALECIIANKSWTGERLSNEIRDVTDAGLCLRCRGELETPAHRYYTCPKNKSILHKDVQNTMDLVGQACSERQNACKWFRGIMPGSSIGNPVGWMDETLCKTVEVGEFTKNSQRNGCCCRRRWRRQRQRTKD